MAANNKMTVLRASALVAFLCAATANALPTTTPETPLYYANRASLWVLDTAHEFGETSLNADEWMDGFYDAATCDAGAQTAGTCTPLWDGSARVKIASSQVAVGGGAARLTMQKDSARKLEFLEDGGFTEENCNCDMFHTGLIRSRETFGPGKYYEINAKVPENGLGSIWFQGTSVEMSAVNVLNGQFWSRGYVFDDISISSGVKAGPATLEQDPYGYHVFGIEWKTNHDVVIHIDGTLAYTILAADWNPQGISDDSIKLMMDLQIEDESGSPTIPSDSMEIEYVRVFSTGDVPPELFEPVDEIDEETPTEDIIETVTDIEKKIEAIDDELTSLGEQLQEAKESGDDEKAATLQRQIDAFEDEKQVLANDVEEKVIAPLQDRIAKLKEQQEQAAADGDEVKAKELANEIEELENSLEALNSVNTVLMETTTEAPVSEGSSGGSGSAGMVAGIVVALLIVIVLVGAVLMKRRNDAANAGKVHDESRTQPGFENPTYDGQDDNTFGGDVMANSSAEQPEYATTTDSPAPGEVVYEQTDDGQATAVFNMMAADESDYAGVEEDDFDAVADAIVANSGGSGSGDVFEVSSPDQAQDTYDLPEPEQSYDLPEPETEEGRADDAKNAEFAEAPVPTSGEQSFEGFGDDLYGESMDFDDVVAHEENVVASSGLALEGVHDGFVEL